MKCPLKLLYGKSPSVFLVHLKCNHAWGHRVSSGRAALSQLEVNYDKSQAFFPFSQRSTPEFQAELKESLNHKIHMVIYVYISHHMNIYKAEVFGDTEFKGFPEWGRALLL